MGTMYKLFLLIAVFIERGHANNCIPRYFGDDSFVCVCNSTYCDETPKNDPSSPEEGNFFWYITSKGEFRMNFMKGSFSPDEDIGNSNATLTVNRTQTFQEIFGFGGAFTDAAGINVMSLSPATREHLMNAYYSDKGSRYSLGRVPIGGTDFSRRPYTYDDVPNDETLSHFALAQEDMDYKIPLIKMARRRSPSLKLIATSWSAPAWMKNTDTINWGVLKRKYYQLYADYIIKFFDAYKKEGLDIWSITPGNEPIDGLIPFFPFNAMSWMPTPVSIWLAEYMGPALVNSVYNETKILGMDDQRFELPYYMDKLCENKKACDYVDGIAYHWYWNGKNTEWHLDETHDHFPDKFIMMTEACTGSNVWEYPKVRLGSWERGERYMLDILTNLNHWVSGWVDWNLALDENGGPNHAHNNVDSPIIVNAKTDEFYKQPMYYALQHFSKFIPRGSIRTSITDTDNIKSAAFLTPLNEVVVVLYSSCGYTQNVVIKDPKKGPIRLELPPYSMHTVIYAK